MFKNIKDHIIYEDTEIIVVHKPGGLPVQTSRLGQKDLISLLKNYRTQKKEQPYIAVIHRLDQPVEGLVLLAKQREAAAKLSRQFSEHTIDKYYRAIVYVPKEQPLTEGEEVLLTDYLLKDGKTNTSKVVKAETQGAKQAILQYKVSKVNRNIAEVWIRLETGRHHQIRVQMAHAKMPLVGDCKYGTTDIPMPDGAGTNIALCSAKISFIHPKTKKKMEFEIEPKNPTFQLL